MWTRYSDDQRAAAMAAYKANGNNLRKTARETGIPKGTLEYWARGDDANPVSDELQTNKNTELVDDLFLLAQALVKAFRPLGILTFQNNGVFSGQETPHFHLHVVPRQEGSDWGRRGNMRASLDA
jgi:hypothetical protein